MLHEYFKVPVLTPGRARHALNTLPAAALAAPGVADRVADVLAAADRLVALKKDYARTKGRSKARGEAVALDNQIDRLVGAIGTVAQANIAALDATNPVHVASKALLDTVLPLGVAAVTTLPFEDELDQVKEMLADLDAAGDLAAQAGVSTFVEQLRALAPIFEAELIRYPAVVEHKAVQAAQSQMQRALAVLIGQLVAAMPQPEDERALIEALTPLRRQFDRVRELRRRSKTVMDVDPVSGVEIEEEGEGEG